MSACYRAREPTGLTGATGLHYTLVSETATEINHESLESQDYVLIFFISSTSKVSGTDLIINKYIDP